MGYRSYTELVIHGELPTRQRTVASHPERWPMQASSVTRRKLALAGVSQCAWWQLPALLRAYVAAVPLTAVALTCLAASRTTWHSSNAWTFCLLITCGMLSV